MLTTQPVLYVFLLLYESFTTDDMRFLGKCGRNNLDQTVGTQGKTVFASLITAGGGGTGVTLH